MVAILGKGIPQQMVSPNGTVLEIDIERSWDELGLDGGHSNEVPVVIFIS